MRFTIQSEHGADDIEWLGKRKCYSCVAKSRAHTTPQALPKIELPRWLLTDSDLAALCLLLLSSDASPVPNPRENAADWALDTPKLLLSAVRVLQT
jgi:hypothetical protein